MEAIGGDELVLKALDEHGGGGGRDNGGGIAGGGGGGGAGEVAASGAGIAKEERIQVSVRLRPLNGKELGRNDPSDWECINDTTIIFRYSLPERSMFPTAYTFDRVFRHDSDTKQVYEEGGKDVALSVVCGINASIFAYGQTSSGKTYTMTGITEYAMTDIYDYIQRHKEREFVLKFSAMEIYNEAVRDLLSADTTPHRLLDDPDRGTTVEKLTEETLRDWDHMKELLSICEAQRQIGETSLNETSSRSHQILRLSVESSAREFLGKDNSSRLAATVDFVDLAGSERASQTLSAGARLKEGCHINRSLLTLGTVIRKLSKGRTGHVPYRDSKLTRILHHSLGGNARTAIICTMSPARSHVEQSRNTLLFASRAKEVATSAQVNVVMSDKALVKHLQKELARLENELRCSGQNSNESLSEALLKEKDDQIQKMEKEIKELTQQRDLAQSRIKDLTRAVGDDEESEHEDGFVQTPTSDMLNINEEKLHSLYDSSSVFDFAMIKSNASLESSSDSANQNDGYQEFTDNLNEHDAISTQDSMSHSSSCGSALPKDQEIITQDDCLDMKDLCREVRCIEIDETSACKNEQSHCLLTEESDNLLPLTTDDNDFGGQEMVAKLKGESTDIDVRKASDHFIKAFPNDSLPWPSMQTLSSSKRLCLTRSRSCKASLVKNSSSPRFPEEQNEKMVLNSYLKDFFGWPQGFQSNLFSLNYRAENETPPEDGRQMSRRKLLDVLKPDNVKTGPEEDITNICTFSAESKAMTETQFQEQLNDGQVVDQKDSDDNKMEEFPAVDQKDSDDNEFEEFPAADQKDSAINDVGLDVSIDSKESPFSPSEFEKQQREIIELWHACHVSLVHRTYFFLLFKGDPSDSIYMEVELRRLSFLRSTFSQGNSGKSMVENGYNITLASSMRALRREREMLCRQMQKRVSAEERDRLYHKWGIPLHSKQRKMQLISLLWGDTRNMDRIRESASVVATLTGLLEPDQALKEMFQLSFTPQRINGRSQSRKRGMSSIM